MNDTILRQGRPAIRLDQGSLFGTKIALSPLGSVRGVAPDSCVHCRLDR